MYPSRRWSSNLCLGNSFLPLGALITVLRWLGKAPTVYTYDRATLLSEMREVGFTDVQERDVGADKLVAFVVARRPG